MSLWQLSANRFMQEHFHSLRSYTSDKFKHHSLSPQSYAVNVVCNWSEIFCGFGAYSVQEVFLWQGRVRHISFDFLHQWAFIGTALLNVRPISIFDHNRSVCSPILGFTPHAGYVTICSV